MDVLTNHPDLDPSLQEIARAGNLLDDLTREILQQVRCVISFCIIDSSHDPMTVST